MSELCEMCNISIGDVPMYELGLLIWNEIQIPSLGGKKDCKLTFSGFTGVFLYSAYILHLVYDERVVSEIS